MTEYAEYFGRSVRPPPSPPPSPPLLPPRAASPRRPSPTPMLPAPPTRPAPPSSLTRARRRRRCLCSQGRSTARPRTWCSRRSAGPPPRLPPHVSKSVDQHRLSPRSTARRARAGFLPRVDLQSAERRASLSAASSCASRATRTTRSTFCASTRHNVARCDARPPGPAAEAEAPPGA